jgi:hypothetical protein
LAGQDGEVGHIDCSVQIQVSPLGADSRAFQPPAGQGQKVCMVNGSVAAYIREQRGLPEFEQPIGSD